MAPPDTGDSGNPFQSLLGDLMNMLGTNAPNQWEMTRSFAVNVATGGRRRPMWSRSSGSVSSSSRGWRSSM